MSLTSYRAAPPRVGVVWVGWKTWRRPTFPRLETQYHRRWGFSRPSSGWDRVRAPRHGHQVVQPTLVWVGGRFWCDGVCAVMAWGSVDDCYAWCRSPSNEFDGGPE